MPEPVPPPREWQTWKPAVQPHSPVRRCSCGGSQGLHAGQLAELLSTAKAYSDIQRRP